MGLNYLFHNDPEIITAMWCIDSETSEELLLDLKTSKVIAKRVNGQIVDPGGQDADSTTLRQ